LTETTIIGQVAVVEVPILVQVQEKEVSEVVALELLILALMVLAEARL
tara:strand:+ start:568 stop:711 length:144 start_codon:yes stop_codon:yes gene_type:complete